MPKVSLPSLARALADGPYYHCRYYVTPEGRVVRCDDSFIEFVKSLDDAMFDGDTPTFRLVYELEGYEFEGDYGAWIAVHIHNDELLPVKPLEKSRYKIIEKEFLSKFLDEETVHILYSDTLDNPSGYPDYLYEKIEDMDLLHAYVVYLEKVLYQTARNWCYDHNFAFTWKTQWEM